MTPPETWTAPDFDTHAAEALALRARLDALVGADHMRGAEQGTVALTGTAQLVTVLEGGTPSLAGVMNAAYRPVVDAVFAEFVEVVGVGPVDLVDDMGVFTPGTAGGIGGTNTRAFNEGGLELRQFIDKGLFAGGALYPYALGLTAGTITPDTVEAIAAAWGANSALDVDGTVTDSASYTRGMGMHGALATDLRHARAYAADAACTAQRDAALVSFFRGWEKAMFARMAFYAHRAAGKLAVAATDDDRIEALHDLAEGLALVLGYRGLSSPTAGPLAGAARITTDAHVDAIVTAFGINASALGSSTTGALVSDMTALQNAITALEATLVQALGLTQAEVEAFRAPTAG